MKSIIFDLDLTLIDSTIAEQARSQRNWNLVYSLIPQFSLYPGMDQIFDIVQKNYIQVCIVSTAPHQYVENVAKHFNIPYNYIVGYHDAKPIKPDAAPMLKALQLMKVSAKDVVSFGDRVIDIIASNAANIESIACFWGSKEKKELIKADYSHAIIHPSEIITLIR